MGYFQTIRTREINRIFRFYQDKTKEFATQYVSDLTERSFQKQQQQGR